MGKEKKEFFILKDGQLMFYVSSEGEVSAEVLQNRMLSAGYLSAILQIVENSSSGNVISSIEMGNKHVFLEKGTFLPIVFVYVIHTKKIREKRESKRMDKAIENFEELFKLEDVTKWNGNMRSFDKCKSSVTDILSF